jgi:hypothetical protein
MLLGIRGINLGGFNAEQKFRRGQQTGERELQPSIKIFRFRRARCSGLQSRLAFGGS